MYKFVKFLSEKYNLHKDFKNSLNIFNIQSCNYKFSGLSTITILHRQKSHSSIQ